MGYRLVSSSILDQGGAVSFQIVFHRLDSLEPNGNALLLQVSQPPIVSQAFAHGNYFDVSVFELPELAFLELDGRHSILQLHIHRDQKISKRFK